MLVKGAPGRHCGRVAHICVGNLTIIGSDNGLWPGRCQDIIWTNVIIMLIGPLGTNFSKIQIEIITFSFNKMRLKLYSAKWRPFCLGLNVLMNNGWANAEYPKRNYYITGWSNSDLLHVAVDSAADRHEVLPHERYFLISGHSACMGEAIDKEWGIYTI